MWPFPLKEDGVYNYKGITIRLSEGKLWQQFTLQSTKAWEEMGEQKNYCLLLEELANLECKKVN